MKPFCVKIHQEVFEFKGRQLDPDNLLMKNRGGKNEYISYEQKDVHRSRNIYKIFLLNPVNMKTWVLIYQSKFTSATKNISESLMGVGRGMEMFFHRLLLLILIKIGMKTIYKLFAKILPLRLR